MAYGIRIFDENGNTRLDINDRLIRHHSTISGSITQSSSPITLYVAGVSNDGTWGLSNDIPLSGSYSSTDDVKLTIQSNNYIKLEILHSVSGNWNYRIQVFRI